MAHSDGPRLRSSRGTRRQPELAVGVPSPQSFDTQVSLAEAWIGLSYFSPRLSPFPALLPNSFSSIFQLRSLAGTRQIRSGVPCKGQPRAAEPAAPPPTQRVWRPAPRCCISAEGLKALAILQPLQRPVAPGDTQSRGEGAQVARNPAWELRCSQRAFSSLTLATARPRQPRSPT